MEQYLEKNTAGNFDGISPLCRADLSVKTIDDEQVVSVRVYPGTKKPYFIKSKGVPDGVYVPNWQSLYAGDDIEELYRTNFFKSV